MDAELIEFKDLDVIPSLKDTDRFVITRKDNDDDPNSPYSDYVATYDQIKQKIQQESIPSGTTEDRPMYPLLPSLRFNTDFNCLEYYNGIDWVSLNGGTQVIFAYWLAKDTNDIPTEDDFITNGVKIAILHDQQSIPFDLTSISDFKYFFLAEPLTEPQKFIKYANPQDVENLGPDAQFNSRVSLETLGYYPSNGQTYNSQFIISLKVS